MIPFTASQLPIPLWMAVMLALFLLAVIGLAIWLVVYLNRKSKARRFAIRKPAYLLQVSQDKITMSSQQSAMLAASVWLVSEKEGYQRAADASLEIIAPPQMQIIRHTAPAGTLRVQVSIPEALEPGEYEVTVSAKTAEQVLFRTVKIVVEEPYRLEFLTEDPNKLFRLTYNNETKSWRPLIVRLRVTNGTNILSLRPDFLVLDSGPGVAWVTRKKLEIRNQALLEGDTLAQFSIQPTNALTFEDLIQMGGKYSLRVVVTPAMAADGVVYEGTCHISIPIPAEIETSRSVQAAQRDGKEGVYLYIRLKLNIASADPALSRKLLETIQVRSGSHQIEVGRELSNAGGWKRAHIYPALDTKNELPTNDLLVLVSAQVGYETLQRVVPVDFQPEPIRLEINPKTIQLDGQADKPVRVLGILELGSLQLSTAEVQAALDSLTIEFDEASRPWLLVSGPVYELSGQSPYAIWTVVGKDVSQAMAGSVPAVALVTLRGWIQKHLVRQEDSITLTSQYQAQVQLSAWVAKGKVAEVRYLRPEFGQPHWDIPNIVYTFHKLGEEYFPIPFSQFTYLVPHAMPEQPALSFDPPYPSLEMDNAFEIPVQLAGSDDLDQSAGSNWLESDGKITVRLRFPEVGPVTREFKDVVTYHFIPSVRMVAFECDESGKPAQGHTYWMQESGSATEEAGVEGQPVPPGRYSHSMQEMEFVADGTDRLFIAAGFRRSDWPAPHLEDMRFLPYGQIEPYEVVVKVNNVPSNDFEVQVAPSQFQGLYLITIRARKPLLANKGFGQRVTLHVAGRLQNAPSCYEIESLEAVLPIKPRYLAGRLWVVPGRNRDSANVSLLAFLAPYAKDVLPGMKVRLAVKNRALEPRLELYGADIVQTDQLGSAQWELFYRGMTWQNLEQAVFEVGAWIEDHKGNSVELDRVTINVRENFALLLRSLYQDRTALQLTNPYFRQIGTHQLVKLFSWRPYLRGPLWSLALLKDISSRKIKAQKPAALEEAERPSTNHPAYFSSEALANRIASWLYRHRHYQPDAPGHIEKMQQMNGIDFEVFQIPGVHRWIGIFPAGMQPLSNPRCLDPWWTQEWEDPRYQVLEAVPDLEAEKAYSLAVTTWLAVNPLAMASAMLKVYLSTTGYPETVSVNEISASVIAAAPTYLTAWQSITPREIDRDQPCCAELNREDLWPYHEMSEFISDWIRQNLPAGMS